MTTISTSVQQSLPRVSYVKAMDVWVFACLFFVCASLLEIALVNFLIQRRQKRSEQKVTTKNITSTEDESTESDIDGTVHKLSRFLFPLGFTVFNVVYWWWFLSKYSDNHKPRSPFSGRTG